MAFKVNTVKRTLNGYPPFLIVGEPKIGKTTLFCDICEEVWGSIEKGVILSMGRENGLESIDGVPYEKIKSWTTELTEEERKLPLDERSRGFVEAVDDLVKNRDTLGFKAVLVDTLDETYGLSDKFTVKTHNRKEKLKKDGKTASSVEGAMGGYGKGRKYSQEIVIEQIDRLQTAGYAVFITGHSKFKNSLDVDSGNEYKKITSNLNSDYYGAVANIAQMIVFCVEEVETEDLTVNEKILSKKSGSTRWMYFRGGGLIDAGGRFSELPDKLEYGAKNFMKAFNVGVESSIRKKTTKKEEEKIIKDEELKIREEAKISEERDREISIQYKEKDFDELYLEYQNLAKEKISSDDGKKEFASLIKELGFKKLSDVKTLDYFALEELVKKLKK